MSIQHDGDDSVLRRPEFLVVHLHDGRVRQDERVADTPRFRSGVEAVLRIVAWRQDTAVMAKMEIM